ncbi:uncharacterized protein P884DRAFT_323125 [Thermothelomyces heterothallicus CBS 202.75]|uniref:uncharacterized protein n=1 Tax=Thermothelomyces heterothallicus CBS 202.75 TaxID=1149848 RepID=UPI00374437D0
MEEWHRFQTQFSPFLKLPSPGIGVHTGIEYGRGLVKGLNSRVSDKKPAQDEAVEQNVAV